MVVNELGSSLRILPTVVARSVVLSQPAEPVFSLGRVSFETRIRSTPFSQSDTQFNCDGWSLRKIEDFLSQLAW